jgi:hypothetical protein
LLTENKIQLGASEDRESFDLQAGTDRRHGMNRPFIAAIGLNTTYERNPRLSGLDTTIYECQW